MIKSLLGPLVQPIAEAAVAAGIPGRWVGYRSVQQESLKEYAGRAGDRVKLEVVHTAEPATNPLPKNVENLRTLPADPGWWGYSFRDVPSRQSGETLRATMPNCLISFYRDPARSNDFVPCIINEDSKALITREIRYRFWHGEFIRRAGPPRRIEKATWFAERVYHNYSHWLTAHLPKLILMQELGLTDDLLMPADLPKTMRDSLDIIGIDFDSLPKFDMNSPLLVGELTLLETDRFRPDLLRKVPVAFGVPSRPVIGRRIFISRERAERRRLLNEDELWKLLEPAGFEKVFMEELDFRQQLALMKDASVICAPHGAGMTNMLFCPPGAVIIEMADPGFPNPNFYALAAALGHDYYIVASTSVGSGHPLEKDMSVDPARLEDVLSRLP
ncbi:glycosyltransferase family 61 protein [Pacificimonas sp. ICDLI1SI03]